MTKIKTAHLPCNDKVLCVRFPQAAPKHERSKQSSYDRRLEEVLLNLLDLSVMAHDREGNVHNHTVQNHVMTVLQGIVESIEREVGPVFITLNGGAAPTVTLGKKVRNKTHAK